MYALSLGDDGSASKAPPSEAVPGAVGASASAEYGMSRFESRIPRISL